MKLFMNSILRFVCIVLLTIAPAVVSATEDGADVTSLLVNGNFNGTGGWTATLNSFDMDTRKHVMEKWWSDWKAEQTVTGVENGVYMLEVQGFRFCSWDWALAAQEWMARENLADKTYLSTSYVRLNDKETKIQNVFACGNTDLKVGYKDANLDYYVPNNSDAAMEYFKLGLYDNVVKAVVTDNTLKIEFDCSAGGFWNCFYNLRLTFVCSDKSDKYQEECDEINNANMMPHSPKLWTGYANPLIDHHYIADPTAVEHDGRLYVYGTNDHQQYENADNNTYEKIKTLSVISTDDMANWTYHGDIPVGEIAPWIYNSWAPSIVSRVEADGKTHFYMYFSNNGVGTAVITSTSPVGPWTSPLNRNLVDGSTPGLNGCPSPFDPGALIDGNGVGWIAFGGTQGRIARLGEDMISFDSEFVNPHPQHHNEANELNYIGGKYVYTYCLDWEDHSDWTLSDEIPTGCCMAYMTSTTPLDGNSWVYGNNYLKNPGDFSGFSYANNHSHLQKFAGKWYVIYHTLMLIDEMGFTGGFRSLQVADIEVDEENAHIYPATINKRGVEQIKPLDPYVLQQAETTAATEGVAFVEGAEPGNMIAKPGKAFIRHAMPKKSVILVRKADFGTKSTKVSARLRGKGSLTVRLENPESAAVATLSVDSNDWTDVEVPCEISGVKNIVFMLEGDIEFDNWLFTDSDFTGVETVSPTEQDCVTPAYNLMGMPVDENYKGIIIKNGKKILK